MFINILKKYLREHTIEELYQNTGVPKDVIYGLAKETKQKSFDRVYLEALYEFFELEKDDFFIFKQKNRVSKTEPLFGLYLKTIREKKNLSRDDLAKQIKIDVRTIWRLETGDHLPKHNSYTMQEVIKALEIDEKEQEIIKKHIEVMKELERLVKRN